MAGLGKLDELLLNATAEQLQQALRQYDPVTWATEVANIYLPKAGKLDFSDHRFLEDVYRDTHPEIVILKGAQLGFSTWAIIRTLWMALTFPCSIIYTFPTKDDVSTYTASRINPVVNGSQYVKDRILDVDSVRVKQFSKHPPQKGVAQIGVSTVYFNGAQTEKDATTVDADMLVHDEEDRANPQIIEQYQSRLDHSKFKWKIRLSTPTRPGFGVSKGYDQSDRRKWLIRCSACNKEFPMGDDITTWDRNLEPKTWEEVEHGYTAKFVCHYCGAEITDEQRINGRWVAERDNPALPHGYLLSQLTAPWVSAADVLRKRSSFNFEGDFYNLVLGLPFLAGANVMSREAILEHMTGETEMVGEGYFMGVDIGKSIDVVIGKWAEGGIPQTVRILSVTDWKELDQLMYQYAIISCVVDALPEERDAKEFQERWNAPGMLRVWRCVYRGVSTSSAQREVLWRDDNDTVTPIVSAPRDEILTRSSNELLARRRLPRFDGSDFHEKYLDHHKNSKKVPVFKEGQEAERVIDYYEWVADGPDHFFHAGTYEMLARMAPRSMAPPVERGFMSMTGVRKRGGDGPATLERPPAVKIQRWG